MSEIEKELKAIKDDLERSVQRVKETLSLAGIPIPAVPLNEVQADIVLRTLRRAQGRIQLVLNEEEGLDKKSMLRQVESMLYETIAQMEGRSQY